MADKKELRVFLSEEAQGAGLTFERPRSGDAGFDLRALESVVLPAGAQMLVSTGIKVAIPDGYVGLVKDRSSMALKQIYTHAGVIDASYRGEVKVVLSNGGETSFQIERGDRIAQLVVVPCLTGMTRVASEADLGETPRGQSGFGSTGRK
ncbi:MAG: dUTP diphosphatase [Candidatus Dadabacteria bacterium]|nr:MAG: dUTP diphosphatase [Candidatus Dadabacteria bacterium]